MTATKIASAALGFDTTTSNTTSTTGTTEVTIATKGFATISGRTYIVFSQIYQVRQGTGSNISIVHRLYAGGTLICSDGGAIGSWGDRTLTAIGKFTATGSTTTVNNTLQTSVSSMALAGSSIFILMVA